jgi:predicted N-acetyltransferase YhbS
MLFRESAPEEIAYIYQMGYKEWKKGRTYEQYVKENQKEDEYGTRYVYVDEENKIIGSLIVLWLNINQLEHPLPLYGIGSVVIDRNYRSMGYGKRMLKDCLSLIEKLDENPIFILYSDIAPNYYYPFNFQELPANLQRCPKSICMVRCSEDSYRCLSKLPLNFIPSYF